MFNVWVAFRNPFNVKANSFKNYSCKTFRIATHKFFEIQLSHYVYNWLEFKLDLNWKGEDHAGPWLMINLFGLTLDARIYDHRHWDYNNQCWADQ